MAECDDTYEEAKKPKFDNHQFRALFTPQMNKLADIFKRYNYELRIAGGAVRDLLGHIMPQDVDLATTATPEEMKVMFEKEGVRMLNTKGEKHGTITARINDKENFEVTTLRIDKVTDGRHAEVEFTKDWELDAERRDLTINSMFLGLDGTLYDFFGGQQDLAEKKVEFVGNAVSRIQEDYLRILRYFRFYGRISDSDDNHNIHTLKAIEDNAAGLADISGERIWMELKKILIGRLAPSTLRCMYQLRLPQYIGLPVDGNVDEFKFVWNRSLSMNPKSMTVLCALFNKEEDVIILDKRVKLSVQERKLGLFLVSSRQDVMDTDELKPFKDMVGQTKDKQIFPKVLELLKYKGNIQLYQDFQKWEIPKFPVSGKDLINMGIQPNKKFGRYMDRLREVWKNSDYTCTKESLLQHAEQFKSN
uniref:CCA tRNA nucleotidyltransferase 1, mitochondrial-like n=1 Tax=Saccoglossus kowalevskii TaxID=10224 RepID=A0ABM0GVR7_SACKO|nr:PREDICTED: CCA tRNA nucleotidyltransferase 1, mitochondrial-like [Saccoglossus kowalevskii]